MAIIPKVSVIVPAYNVASYIGAALHSLEKQTLQEFEVLVVDDGSTDTTADVVQAFCQRDARFRLLQKTNGGLSSARNFGIDQAKADYIALLDGDDAYHPKKLANHVTSLEKFADVGVVYSASRVMRDDGRLTWMSLSGKPRYNDPLLSLLCKNFIGHGSNAVFRRGIVDQVGGFDETLRSSEDIDFWLRIATTRCWQFRREAYPLCYYRVRPSGLSFNVEKMQHCSEKVIELAYQRSPKEVGPILATAQAYLYRYLARISIVSGQEEHARSFIKQALAADASIFYQDPRSLLTLLAVQLAPFTRFFIERSLNSVESIRK